MNLITELNQKHTKQRITDFKVGDTVRVHQKIIEGGKERIQIFEGVVIKTRAGKNINGTFTVRKISEGVGVEKIYLVHSPKVTKIEVLKRGKVRRANLSYLRNLRGKKARLKEKQFDSLIVNVEEEPTEQPNNETTSNVAGATEQPNDQKTIDDMEEKIENKGKEMSNKKKGNSEEDDSDNDSDEEVTELKEKDEEDEEKLKEMSVEKVAELERKASEKAHRKEEEDIERDETEDVEEETDLGLEKAEDEDTRGQQEKPRKK